MDYKQRGRGESRDNLILVNSSSKFNRLWGDKRREEERDGVAQPSYKNAISACGWPLRICFNQPTPIPFFEPRPHHRASFFVSFPNSTSSLSPYAILFVLFFPLPSFSSPHLHPPSRETRFPLVVFVTPPPSLLPSG